MPVYPLEAADELRPRLALQCDYLHRRAFLFAPIDDLIDPGHRSSLRTHPNPAAATIAVAGTVP
jgi:hypothetical protein